MKKWTLLLVSSLFLVLLLAACGGGEEDNKADTNESASSENGEVVDIKASNWEFDKEEYTVPAGEVTVQLTSEDGYHGISIDNTDIAIENEGTATANLEAGEYTIRCSIPCGTGHDEMVATLVVQ
ncbi:MULTISPECIES: cytochrome c oxidase subunit II [unclassified Gracilibacillus]|uniref:cytochrome c oxidase subunit II n=1 Tax=Gracilibacillus sp. JCM 18860 TaxID=1306159 RepID=UPI0006D08005